MPNDSFYDFEKEMLQSRINGQHDKFQGNVNGINRVIRRCQREYDRLCDSLHRSEVVQKVAGAVGVLSSLALMPSDYPELASEAPDLITTPAGKVVLAVAMGSFAVAGISKLIGDKISDKIEENEEQQDELYSDLEYEQSSLIANENVQAINQVKSAIHGDDLTIPEDAIFNYDDRVIPGLAATLPKIVVIDAQQDFQDLPQQDDLGQ